eukprot:GHVN01098439.1.p1 GENE.GHVN01098439.1~~GHVN01098439.1.p1  ORF type:complete len:310 (-),score=31.69 GHVN01098439.1:366-1295(-)
MEGLDAAQLAQVGFSQPPHHAPHGSHQPSSPPDSSLSLNNQSPSQSPRTPAPRVHDFLKAASSLTYRGDRTSHAINTWLFQVEQYLAQMKIPHTKWASWAALLLREEAATWWQLQVEASPRGTVVTWVAFSEALKTQFAPPLPALDARVRLDMLRQANEKSLDEYVSKFESILLDARDVAPSEAIHRFCQGLKPNCRRELFIRQPPSLEAAIQLAFLIEHGQHTYQLTAASTNSHKPPHHSGHSRPTPMELDQVSTRRPDRPNHNVTCWNCGIKGHKRQDCRKPQSSHAPLLPTPGQKGNGVQGARKGH